MALNAAGINAILEDGNEAVIWVAIGDAVDQTSDQRRQVLTTVVSGVITPSNAPYAFTGAPGAGATHAQLFSAATGGTFYGFDTITGDQAFNAAGEYELTTITITGTSS